MRSVRPYRPKPEGYVVVKVTTTTTEYWDGSKWVWGKSFARVMPEKTAREIAHTLTAKVEKY